MADDTEYTSSLDCLYYPKFSNFGWESLYKKYMISMMKVLDVYKDVSRLYLLIQIDLSENDVDLVIDKLLVFKLNQDPVAVHLTNDLNDILPNADPIYLDIVGEIYASDHRGVYKFLKNITMKKRSYAKLYEYYEKVKILKVINSLTKNFKVEEFLRMCPNPEHYFKNLKYNSHKFHFYESLSYLEYTYNCIKNTTYLALTLETNKFNLTKTIESMEWNLPKNKAKLRNICSFRPEFFNFTNTENVEFLKEMAYLDHKEEILNFIRNEQRSYKKKFAKAKANDQLRTCECCYNNRLLDSEVYSCPAGHVFCAGCIKIGTKVKISHLKYEIQCFAECTEVFNLSVLKEIIDDKLYKRIIRLKQVQEIKAANIEGLESCGFCDFFIILPPEVKIIRCLNPECKKETCRDCREESHIPYKCDDVEQTPERKMRKMIENKMSEVLIRNCPKCNRPFVKEYGCNHMICNCGQHMCYICKKILTSGNYWQHFFTENIIKDKCPLNNNEHYVTIIAVEAAARLAINKIKTEQPELYKKVDIQNILPNIKKNKECVDFLASLPGASKVIHIVAKLTGQSVEDIRNLKENSE